MSERTPLLLKPDGDVTSILNSLDYWLILPALLSNMFLAAFESTIAASTQSAVGATFAATDNIAWVATSYLIVSTSVQPLYGRAADLFGRTRVYLFSLSLFGAGCAACGFSNSLAQMIVARAVCGIGGGGLITISQVCAWDVLPNNVRPLYQALNNVTFGMGAAVGASLGGFLADSIGWRWAYYFPVPLCMISTIVFVVRARPKLAIIASSREKKFETADVDFIGSALLMFSITFFLIVVNLGGDEIPWTSPVIPAILVVAFGTSVLFAKHEARVPLPVLPISLIRGRYMLGQIGLNLFGPMAVFGTLYLIPPFFQTTLLSSASVASRRLIYPTLTAPIGSVITGILLHRHPDKAYIGQKVGAIILFLGTILILVLSFENNIGKGEAWFVSHLIWVHLGMGIMFPSTLLDLLSNAGNNHAAVTSLIFLLRSVGTVVGISASQAILQNVLLNELNDHIIGDGSSKIIQGIRQSIAYLADLPDDVRTVAIECYKAAFQASFILVVVMAACVVLSAAIGIGTKRYIDEESSLSNESSLPE